jgi:hypothetical protein
MKTSDEILRQNGIVNPTDSALVRLSHRAIAEPELTSATLLDHSGLHNPTDRALAKSLIESIREAAPATLPEPTSSAAGGRLRTTLVALAIALLVSLAALSGTAVAYFNISAESKGRGAKIAELEGSLQTQQDLHTKEYATLSVKTTAALSSAGVSAEEFKTATGDYLAKADLLAKEIADLRAENAKLKAGSIPAPK